MLEKKLLLELEEYIEKHTNHQPYFSLSEPARTTQEDRLLDASPNEVSPNEVSPNEISPDTISPDELEGFLKQARKPTFNKILFQFIDSKGATDSDIYKRAGIDRRHFSKIRSSSDYKPGKHTVIALALALELNQTQMNQLLGAAGYSLSDSDTFDLVIRFFLERQVYDIDFINDALYHFDLQPL